MVLEHERLCAELDRNEARLDRGDHGLLLPELISAVAAYPFDERRVGQLMLALTRSGRRADAIMEYRNARHWFREELGIDPSGELQRLFKTVLDGDTVGAVPLQQRPNVPVVAVPAQLPPDVPGFIGRAPQLAQLNAAGDHATAVTIYAISGTAGVGKPNPGYWYTITAAGRISTDVPLW